MRRFAASILCALACIPPLVAAWCVGRLAARVVEPVVWALTGQ